MTPLLRRVPLRATARCSPAPRRVLCSGRASDPSEAGLSWTSSAAAGSFAGVMSALTGAGGGILLIPLLAKLTAMTQQTINGTQHGAVTFSVLLGASNHLQSGACNVPLALITTLPSFLFARYGVQTAHKLSSKRLSLLVGSAMLMCTPMIVLKDIRYMPKLSGSTDPLDLQFYRPRSTTTAASSNDDGTHEQYMDQVSRDIPGFVRVNAKYVLAGCFAGFISGLCGMGGGILMTAYLTTASDMPQEFIIGNLAAVNRADSGICNILQRQGQVDPCADGCARRWITGSGRLLDVQVRDPRDARGCSAQYLGHDTGLCSNRDDAARTVRKNISMHLTVMMHQTHQETSTLLDIHD